MLIYAYICLKTYTLTFSWEEKVTKRALAIYNRQAAPSVQKLGNLQICGDIGYPLSLSIQKKDNSGTIQ